jgi:putative peptidoglycan lipid II flippase
MKTASWTLGMLIVTQIGGIVQTAVASRAIQGRELLVDNQLAIASVAAMSIAWLIFMLPHSVATVSIATAYFTRMSVHAMEKNFDDLKKDLVEGLRTIAMISVLATTALIVLAYPVSRIFVGELPGAIALGNVVIAMVVGLLPFSFVFMIQRAFYSLEDTRTPFVFTIVQVGVNITGSLLVGLYVEDIWMVVGLSLVTSASIMIQFGLAFALFRRKFGSLSHGQLTLATIKFLVAAIPAGGAGYWLLQVMGGIKQGAFPIGSVLSAVVTCMSIGAVIALVYILVLKLLRVKEVDILLAPIVRLLRR